MRNVHSNGPFRALALPILPVLFLVASACGDNGEDPITPPPNGNGEPEAATVTGEVTHADAGVGSVELELRDGPGADRSLTTPNDGSFAFEDVEPGTWSLEVIPPDYFQLAPGQSAVRSVQVAEGGTSTVNVTLEPVEELDLVEIDATAGLTFTPSDVTVAPGTRIRWENTSTVLHTVTPDGHSEWSEGTIGSQGDTFEAVMNNPGSFDYFCVPHQGDGMIAVLNVEP